jgi:hypothetical protein
MGWTVDMEAECQVLIAGKPDPTGFLEGMLVIQLIDSSILCSISSQPFIAPG